MKLISTNPQFGTTVREFPSGAEAIAYYHKLGYETIENEFNKFRTMINDDGDVVRIRNLDLLLWEASETKSSYVG